MAAVVAAGDLASILQVAVVDGLASEMPAAADRAGRRPLTNG